MKYFTLLPLLFLMICCTGCVQRSAFDELKTHINTSQATSPETMLSYMERICDRRDYVQFLKAKTESNDPRDAITAYLVLTSVVTAIRETPSPEGQEVVDRIEPEKLAAKFEKFDASMLGSNWQDCLTLTNDEMRVNLGKPPANETPEAAPKEPGEEMAKDQESMTKE